MGPLGSPIAHIGVQLTDSAYVAVSMRIMTRMGKSALDVLGQHGEFVPCLHPVGYPLPHGREDVAWPADADNKWIVHFPETREIWSYGLGYGGNALLGKKCLALRIASVLARDEGWMAEHMLILKVTCPEGQVKHIAAAFPSACAKTNLAMLIPTLPRWKVETIGDDIAWIKLGSDRRLHAINPEAGCFGVAPGTNEDTNPNAMATLATNCIFTNCALTDDGDVWWEGMTDEPPAHLVDWQGHDWAPDSDTYRGPPQRPLHRAGRAVPVDRARVGRPRRRPDRRVPARRPPVAGRPARARGPRLGARRVHGRDRVLGDHRAAAAGELGKLRHDPFAMLPFCGYHMADYFGHWLKIGRTYGARLPKIFYVSWFRKTPDGRWLWPGYGENSRVLEWISRRCDNAADANETPIGLVPTPGAIDTDGLDTSQGRHGRVAPRRPRRMDKGAARHPPALRALRPPPARRAAPAASTPRTVPRHRVTAPPRHPRNRAPTTRSGAQLPAPDARVSAKPSPPYEDKRLDASRHRSTRTSTTPTIGAPISSGPSRRTSLIAAPFDARHVPRNWHTPTARAFAAKRARSTEATPRPCHASTTVTATSASAGSVSRMKRAIPTVAPSGAIAAIAS